MTASGNFAQVLKTVLVCLLLIFSSVSMASEKDDQTRTKVREQSQKALARLYAAKPEAQQVIAKSKGYATFSRWGMTLGAVGGSIGKGLLVDQPSGKETFMRFVEGSAGLGLGIKKYDVIFVFSDQKALDDFATNGWQAGGNATATAKTGPGGLAMEGAASVSPGVWVYQITDKGLAAEVGIKGTKYYKDTSLNTASTPN